jgi:hypothetical protein
MLEKLTAFAEQTGMNLKDAGDVEAIFLERQAGAGEAVGRCNLCISVQQSLLMVWSAGPRTYNHQTRRDVDCPDYATSTCQSSSWRFSNRSSQ